MMGYILRLFVRRWVWIIAGAILFAVASYFGVELR